MIKLRRRTARAMAAGVMLLTMGLPLGAGRAAPPRTKFVLPGGEVVIGQVVSSDGEMYVIKLPRGVVMLRKDFPVAIKALNAARHEARQSPRMKPVL